MVSYQGHSNAPGFRWFKYREGFSRQLVELLLAESKPSRVLDPFSGLGTTPLTAVAKGLRGTGIELLPVGIHAAKAISIAGTRLDADAFAAAAQDLLTFLQTSEMPSSQFAYPHISITQSAFPPATEHHLAKARQFLTTIDDIDIHTTLNTACMSVLESVSYTVKDGQYLRWDYRSGRKLKTRLRKNSVLPFPTALQRRIADIVADIDHLRSDFNGDSPTWIEGSTLKHLRNLPPNSYDAVITSPPYANRSDYTRTYALELAWLGYTDEVLKRARQSLVSSTVESKSKRQYLSEIYNGSPAFTSAVTLYESQQALHEVLHALEESSPELSNRHVIRMLRGYFFEMALIIAELRRIVKHGGAVAIVNDNVQYHGEEVPVDLILSDYAEQSGFACKHIWTLRGGKGNSSQQMKRFGRQEQRRCIYWWTRGTHHT